MFFGMFFQRLVRFLAWRGENHNNNTCDTYHALAQEELLGPLSLQGACAFPSMFRNLWAERAAWELNTLTIMCNDIRYTYTWHVGTYHLHSPTIISKNPCPQTLNA